MLSPFLSGRSFAQSRPKKATVAKNALALGNVIVDFIPQFLVSDKTACALVHWPTPQLGNQTPPFEWRGGHSRPSNPATLLPHPGAGVLRRFLRFWVSLLLSLPPVLIAS